MLLHRRWAFAAKGGENRALAATPCPSPGHLDDTGNDPVSIKTKRSKSQAKRHMDEPCTAGAGVKRHAGAQEMGRDEKDEHSSEAKALAAALSPATWPEVLLQLLDLTTELSGNGLLQAAAGAQLRLSVRLSGDDWIPGSAAGMMEKW